MCRTNAYFFNLVGRTITIEKKKRSVWKNMEVRFSPPSFRMCSSLRLRTRIIHLVPVRPPLSSLSAATSELAVVGVSHRVLVRPTCPSRVSSTASPRYCPRVVLSGLATPYYWAGHVVLCCSKSVRLVTLLFTINRQGRSARAVAAPPARAPLWRRRASCCGGAVGLCAKSIKCCKTKLTIKNTKSHKNVKISALSIYLGLTFG